MNFKAITMKKCFLPILLFFAVEHSSAQLISDTVIGQTMYDIQCNASSYNRISLNLDGTISAVWNFSPDSSVGMPMRGTGYNYFDGSSWLAWPTTRTEAFRTGFTNILTTASGHELSIQHSSNSISVNYRPTKGTGAWTYSQPWGNTTDDSWPKAVASGDSVYVIWNGSGISNIPVAGQSGPIYFSRSYDGGQSWTPRNIIPLIDSSYYSGFLAEDYAIDAKGSTVAILFGDTRTDLGILKSLDGGQTWTKIIVQTHPIPHYGNFTQLSDTNNDGIADTLHTASGDQAILIDNNGDCHVWFSEYRWFCDLSTIGSYNYLPDLDGLNYWNEAMGTDNYIKIALPQDFNGNGQIDYPIHLGLCQQYNNWSGYSEKTGKPSVGIDASGTIYMAYQSIDESSDTTLWSTLHTHCYVKTLPQLGGSYNVYNWTYPFDIARSVAQGGNGEFEECVFPSITRNIGQYAYVLYQRDGVPGLKGLNCPATSSINSYTNDIVLSKLDALTLGIRPTEHTIITFIGVSPNPTQQNFILQFNLKEQSAVSIELISMTGKIVYRQFRSKMSAGVVKDEISTLDLAPGIYTCSVVANSQRTSTKVVVLPH